MGYTYSQWLKQVSQPNPAEPKPGNGRGHGSTAPKTTARSSTSRSSKAKESTVEGGRGKGRGGRVTRSPSGRPKKEEAAAAAAAAESAASTSTGTVDTPTAGRPAIAKRTRPQPPTDSAASPTAKRQRRQAPKHILPKPSTASTSSTSTATTTTTTTTTTTATATTIAPTTSSTPSTSTATPSTVKKPQRKTTRTAKVPAAGETLPTAESSSRPARRSTRDSAVAAKTDRTPQPSRRAKPTSHPTRWSLKDAERSEDRVRQLLGGKHKLQYILKGHADQGRTQIGVEETEELTNMWACEFEPRQSTDANPGLVAVCGGTSLLLVDVQQGRYVKKYSHNEPKEEFLCVAWTLLRGPDELQDDKAPEDAHCSIVAVAGRLGSIKLINTLHNECYDFLMGHEKQVHRIQFSRERPRWLLSASDDMTIRLWDIGAPHANQAACLAQFQSPPTAGVPSCFGFSADLSLLVAGCRNGTLLQFMPTAADLKKLAPGKAMRTFRPKKRFPAGDEWHEGYVDDVYVSHTGNSVVSRATEDEEILVWRANKSTASDADVAASFEWPDSEGFSGLRFKVFESAKRRALLAGDYEGRILVYDMARTSKTLDDGSFEQFPPDQTLFHTQSNGLVRDVCLSPNGQYLVSVDSNNSVFIWKSES